MPDMRSSGSGIDQDSQHIKTAFLVFEVSMEEVCFGYTPDLTLFRWSDRILRRTEGPIRSGFNFNKNKHILFIGDDVDLSAPEPISLLDKPKIPAL